MKTICGLLLGLICFAARSSEDIGKIGAPAEERPLIQMTILLDTSGSGNGQFSAPTYRTVVPSGSRTRRCIS